MIEPRCLIGVIHSRDSFPEIFAGTGKWFRRRRGIVSSETGQERGLQLRRPYISAITSPVATKAFTPVTAMPR